MDHAEAYDHLQISRGTVAAETRVNFSMGSMFISLSRLGDGISNRNKDGGYFSGYRICLMLVFYLCQRTLTRQVALLYRSLHQD
jgi:hypothetical protein